MSLWVPIISSLLYTTFYIAPFYLSATLRHTPLNSRDAPPCIRARIRAVGLTCLACTSITVTILLYSGGVPSVASLAHQLGLLPINPVDIVRVLALASILFACSLFETLVVDRSDQFLSIHSIKQALWTDLRSHRNLVIAPLSEELVFRSLIIPMYLHAQMSPSKIVFLTPLVFGLAHAHHLVEFLQTFSPPGTNWWTPPGRVLLSGLVRTGFQFTYTSVFGFFAAFVFLRTGSFWACVIVHAFCNFMGVPRLWGRVGQVDEDDEYQASNTTPDVAQGRKVDGADTAPSSRSAGVWWTVGYYALIPVGVYGFSSLLWPWTESANALAEF